MTVPFSQDSIGDLSHRARANFRASLMITIVITSLAADFGCKTKAQSPNCIATSLPEVTNSVNSFRESNVIIIGRTSNRLYVVVVPGKSDKLLTAVRRYIADAFLAQHRLGAYVYAGGFAQRGEAECVSYLLRSHGLDARVVYFQ
jgi:hypothetical protein